MSLRSAVRFIMAFCLLVSVVPEIDAREIKRIRAEIDLSEQQLYLFRDGRLTDKWPVSTARRGYRTPVGRFHPIRLERSWYSRKYDWAPMPHSVFFLGGYAIHGTTEINRLGRAVSHGCIRLHPSNAAMLFNLVKQVGRKKTDIVIRR